MGKNLAMKDARTKAGLSQQELADRLGVSRQTINAIEKGDYNPTIKLCVGICRVLGLTLNDLFWNEAEFKNFEKKRKKHLHSAQVCGSIFERLKIARAYYAL